MELKIKEVENKCEKNLKIMEKKVEDKITEELDKQVTEKLMPIQQEVGEIQERLRTRPPTPPEKIQVVVNGGISRAEPEKKFYGDTRTNPKTFIKNLEGLATDMGPGPELKKFIRSMLGGDAELWYDIVEEEFDTIQEFSHLFLKYFWGDHVQSKIRENLFNGKYNENMGSSREKYAIKKYSTAKQLDPPMTEEDIIKYISRHFDLEVTNSIALHEINQIGRLLDYLKRIDDVRRPRKNFDRRDGGSAGQEQRPENKNYRWDGGSTGQQNRPERQNNQDRYQRQNGNGGQRQGPNQPQSWYRNDARQQGPNYRSNNVNRDRRGSPRRENSRERSRERSRSPSTNSKSTSNTNQQPQITDTKPMVTFNEIATVHEPPTHNQNF